MDAGIARQLQDKMYEKRKAAAHELEKHIREYHLQGEDKRISQVIDQLVDLFSSTNNPLHVRNGGLIGLAGTAIALLTDIAPYMERFIEPLLLCFTDAESRIRYFSAECLYNIAKVSKGEILVYFNPIFDGLSKLSADVELSVKNGAELLDRLMKDIIAESASVYIPQYPETTKISELNHRDGILIPRPDYMIQDDASVVTSTAAHKAFSLAHFIPLLSERIYVLSPFARSFLVSWITVLDSVPELELVSYLPEFLDGLMKYLADPTQDVKVATENLLADFLREIREITIIQRREAEKRQEHEKGKEQGEAHESLDEEPDSGVWLPGQGVWIEHAAIIEILIQQLDNSAPEIIQQSALYWISSYLQFNPSTIIPFTPVLIPLILPNLAHHVDGIRSSARGCNSLLWNVIRDLEIKDVEKMAEDKEKEKEQGPSVASARRDSSSQVVEVSSARSGVSSPPLNQVPSQAQGQPVAARSRASLRGEGAETPATMGSISPMSEKLPLPPANTTSTNKSRQTQTASPIPALEPAPNQGSSEIAAIQAQSNLSRAGSPLPPASATKEPPPPVPPLTASPDNSLTLPQPDPPSPTDPFDYLSTIDSLRIQFMAEHEDTRIAAMKWLIMLHQKVPKQILAMDEGTFPALLKTLSDSSEEVVKHDLLLLAQICSTSSEAYFRSFMIKLLELFSTDRRLLESRGSLIIRQLCLSLQTERIYKSLAEILEREEDLEFASHMIQTLNLILITSPELGDLRKRLKSLETRQDGQALFISLYRSWCHNAVAVFSLCLLAQAYEHASNLLQIFAELEITVPMLVQIDRLVQLIESPIFTYLRLQLLEPEKHPYLYKCLYGLLMLLPQSTAFGSLRNRLNAVNSMGFLHLTPRTSVSTMSSNRTKIPGRDDIKWQELFSHFRLVQSKQEKARRQSQGLSGSTIDPINDPRYVAGFLPDKERSSATTNNPASPTRPPVRRKVTTSSNDQPQRERSGSSMLSSPLNPKTRANGLLATALSIGGQSKEPKIARSGRTFSLNQGPLQNSTVASSTQRGGAA